MAEELLELVEELRAVVAEREPLSTCCLVTVAELREAVEELREEEPGLT